MQLCPAPSCPGSGWGPASQLVPGLPDFQDMLLYKTGVLHLSLEPLEPALLRPGFLQLELSECLVPGQTVLLPSRPSLCV